MYDIWYSGRVVQDLIHWNALLDGKLILHENIYLTEDEKNKSMEREIQIKSCRYVDYYFIYSTEQTLLESLDSLKPNVRFLGDDYTGKKFTGDDRMIPVIYHPRSVHTYSTTALRKHIYMMELEKLNKIK